MSACLLAFLDCEAIWYGVLRRIMYHYVCVFLIFYCCPRIVVILVHSVYVVILKILHHIMHDILYFIHTTGRTLPV